jgi:hypothetical protein
MSVLLAVQMVVPRTESDEQELTTFGVEIEAGDPLPSIGTTLTPVPPLDQYPFGTYAVTGAMPVVAEGTSMPMELPGLQDPTAVLECVTVILEQLLLAKVAPLIAVPEILT